MTRSVNQSSAEELSMGIDVGSQAVKFVLAEQASSRSEIKGAVSYTQEHSYIESGVVKEPRKFARTLASKCAEYDVQRAEAVLSIPSNLAVLRWVTLPFLKDEELREAARFKVKKHLPFPVESAYVQATTPDAAEGGGIGQSLVIAVKREVIDSRAEAVELAGINVVGAELEAQAILRVVEMKLRERSALWRDASMTIIDIGANNTHMYVVQNQKLSFIRGVKFGGLRIAEAVANEFNCTIGEADVLVGLPDTHLTQDGMLHMTIGDLPARLNVQAEVEKLTREFLRLLRYFRSMHAERSYAGILDHLLLCGGFASLNGLDEYLESVLGLRVERAKPFEGMVGKFNRETFESISGRQEAFTVAAGLALSGLDRKNQSTGDHGARREYAWARSA
jgi:type IV pilus assembly protein PilM